MSKAKGKAKEAARPSVQRKRAVPAVLVVPAILAVVGLAVWAGIRGFTRDSGAPHAARVAPAVDAVPAEGAARAGRGVPATGVVPAEGVSPPDALDACEVERADPATAALKAEVLELVARLTREHPGVPEIFRLLGEAHFRFGRSTRAEEAWRAALAIDPSRGDILNQLGWIAMGRGDYEEATAHWRRALELSPDLAGVRNSLARALMGLGRHDEALETLLADVQVAPGATASHFLLGQEYLQRKAFEKAVRHYEIVVAQEPEHTNAYYGLMTACARLGRKEDAARHRATFKALKDREYSALKERDTSFDDARYVAQHAAKLLTEAGVFLAGVHRGDQADALWRRATALDPENVTSRMNRAFRFQGRGMAAEALALFEEIMQLAPGETAAHMNAGVLYAQLGRMPEAEATFKRVISLAPDRAWGYRELARLYLVTNHALDRVRSLAEKSVMLDPAAESYFVLGWACDRTGYRGDAVEALRRALELDPGNAKYRRVYMAVTGGQ